MSNQAQNMIQMKNNPDIVVQVAAQKLSDIILKICDPLNQPHVYVGDPEKLAEDITRLFKEAVEEKRRGKQR